MNEIPKHNWAGTSESMLIDGKIIQKKTAVMPFMVYAMTALIGLFVVVRFSDSSWPLHVLGIVITLFGTVASFRYRYYSNWFGLIVVLIIAGSVVQHVLPSR